MNQLIKIFHKEFNAYFASPAAWLFIGTFLIVTLFAFFWAEAFFARNIADMKPFFKWVPVLLVFLVGTLSMRTWSEERRSGTIESLLTSPVGAPQIIFGKFLANLSLVGLALLLTFPLAFSVSMMGPLDWGPVIGGYLASMFLAAAYVAIGLYMSGRTDNPIIALILTVSCAGAFYMIGSNMLTTLFSNRVAGILELIGSGSRFDSITRGVLDIRDIYYYLSIVGTFLVLNMFSLERIRWAGNRSQSNHRQWIFFTFLAVTNLLVANIWLSTVRAVRIDLTEGKSYSLSSATNDYIAQAYEPLLIRGYFSQKSHPLLEPLIPQLKDLLEEYQVVGGSKIRVEFIDPHSDQDIEAEAADKYGIRPVPFRMASRYEAGVVNSYFDLVIAYGDEYEVLSFNDLIEVKSTVRGDPEVLLNNPEYAITSALRKVISSYRSGGDVYTDLPENVSFRAYVSPSSKLPQAFSDFREVLENTLKDIAKQSEGKISYEFSDPDANGGKLAELLNTQYGFVPQIAGLFDTQPFWFYMVLEGKNQSAQISLPEEFSENSLKTSIESALKRMAPGYMKTIAVVAPERPVQQNPYMPPPPGKSYNDLRAVLEENVRVIDADISQGSIPTDVDMLFLLAPENLSEKAIFAIDQFLMQGGSVVISTAPFNTNFSNTLSTASYDSGLDNWLDKMGFKIDKEMVLDPQNASLPIPVPRNVGPISINEIVMMPYPHFPDVRPEGLNDKHPVTAGLSQLTLNWASPLTLAADKHPEREFIELVKSSPSSWTSAQGDVMPDYQLYPQTGFSPTEVRSSYTMAALSQGRFLSYFKGKDSPLLPEKLESEESDEEVSDEPEEDESTVYGSVIQSSSDSARLIVISSNSFAEDMVLNIASQGVGTEYTAPLEFMQNLVDWSLEDSGLLSIRSRAQLARILYPMDESKRRTFEYGNYAAVLVGLSLVWLMRLILNKRKHLKYKQYLAEI